MKEHEIIRRSTTVLLFKIIVAEIITEVFYLSISALISFAAYSAVGINAEPLRLATNLIMTTIGVSLFAIIVIMWMSEGLSIDKEEITYRQGVLNSTMSTYPYTNIQRVTVQQSFIGKFLNFGTINLYSPVLGQDLVFHEMPSPHELARTIKNNLNKPDREQFLIKK